MLRGPDGCRPPPPQLGPGPPLREQVNEQLLMHGCARGAYHSPFSPLPPCRGTDTQSCQASLQSNAEASGHIRSAWRFLVTVTVMLYLLFGAVDSLRDAHKRAVYFTELGCITKIGVAWGIVLLKAGTVPFENGTGVIAYPSVFALLLLPGVVATLVMLAPGPGR